MIQDYVREEVYYREALAHGLDKDDIVIRRRLRQKMEFVTDDVAAQAEPTDDELSAYLKAHREPFRVERRSSFSQVYLNPDRHGQNLARDAELLLAKLNEAGGKADVSALGDPFLLSHRFEAVPANEIAKQFGEAFAAKLGSLSPGQWQGPVNSATACIWCSSASARGDASPRRRKSGRLCDASGPTPSGWKPTRSSIKGCANVTP